jgi:hypothetical protein
MTDPYEEETRAKLKWLWESTPAADWDTAPTATPLEDIRAVAEAAREHSEPLGDVEGRP